MKLDREIEVVENIISVLNRCFILHLKRMNYEDAKKTLKDINLVKKELKKLLKMKETELEGELKMGENVELVLLGILCSECGSFIEDNATGFPRSCSDCEQKNVQ